MKSLNQEQEDMEKKLAENRTIIEDLQKSVHNFIE